MYRYTSLGLAIGFVGLGLLAVPEWSYGGTIASSAGTLTIDKSFSRFSPGRTATGSVFAHAAADNVIGGAPEFTGFLDGVPNGGSAGTLTLSRGPLAGPYSGRGIFDVVKLPNDHSASAFMQVTVDGTTSTSSGSWISNDPPGMRKRADFKSTAGVTRNAATAPPGTAVGNADDPEFLTPDTSTDLNLVVTLSDVSLLALADPGEFSAAQIEAAGAFGLGSQPGSNELAQWDFFQAITSNNTFMLPMATLLDEVFPLEPGNTYWLTANLTTSAFGVAEPSSIALLATAIVGLLGWRLEPWTR